MKSKFSLIILPNDFCEDDSENTEGQMVLKHLVPSFDAQDASYYPVNVLRHRWLH